MTCDLHSSSVKVFSDVQLLYFYLVHICLLISHGNCFCAPLKWTLRKFDSWWCKHLQTHVATITVFPNLSHWIAVVLRLFLKFPVNCSSYFLKTTLTLTVCQCKMCKIHMGCFTNLDWTSSPNDVWIIPDLLSTFGFYLISSFPSDFVSHKFQVNRINVCFCW